MELAEGRDLADRIARSGPIPVDDALPSPSRWPKGSRPPTRHGIIHRDLKPANVMLRTPDFGKVKVLDFGLAKAWQPEESDADLTHSPTLTAQMTAAGVLLGTAAYMSPEQARGKPVDKRTDVWSFGCVLFEMLTGAMCHQGETVSDTLAGILTRAPDWKSLPSGTAAVGVPASAPVPGEGLAPRRLRDIGEARIALEDFETGAVSDGRDDGAGQSSTSKRPWRALPWVIVAATAAAAVALGWVASRPEPRRLRRPVLPSTCLLESPTVDHHLQPLGGVAGRVASGLRGLRDGDRPRLYLRELSRETRRIFDSRDRGRRRPLLLALTASGSPSSPTRSCARCRCWGAPLSTSATCRSSTRARHGEPTGRSSSPQTGSA